MPKVVTLIDGSSNVIYENGTAKRLLHDEGYVDLSNDTYYYYLKDYQGNNRVVINSSGTVQETNHYYPFGGIFSTSTNVQPYKYNGKELDTKKGLNLYDYGARHYDAALGRFHTQDRFAEKFSALSPYQYGANSPICNVDINGDSIVVAPNPNGFLDNIRMRLGMNTKYQTTVYNDLAQLKNDNSEVAQMITDLENSENIHTITKPERGDDNEIRTNQLKVEEQISQGSTIKYDPYQTKDVNGVVRTPRVALAHELQHAYDIDKGLGTLERNNNIRLMDIKAINTENKIRKITGDPKRTTYAGIKVPEDLLE